jgi:hypothetical protein
MLNEIFIKLIFCHVMFFTDFVQMSLTRGHLGQSITFLILTVVIINFGDLLLGIIRQIIEACKAYKHKPKAISVDKMKKIKVKKAPLVKESKPDETVLPDALDQNLEIIMEEANESES